MTKATVAGYLLVVTSLGLCNISARSIEPSASRSRGSTSQDAAIKANKEFDTKFKLLRVANGVTPEGVVFSRNTYRGPDGEKVYFVIFHFQSAERARDEFEKDLKKAKKVLDHPAAEHDGDRVDEYAVITTIDQTIENSRS